MAGRCLVLSNSIMIMNMEVCTFRYLLLNTSKTTERTWVKFGTQNLCSLNLHFLMLVTGGWWLNNALIAPVDFGHYKSVLLAM